MLAAEGDDAAEAVFAAFAHLKGVPGRLERIGEVRGALCIVDYAHKPDALEHVLDALRPFTSGRLVCVFGCGGDRDRGKRPVMGRIASERADIVIVTDDNPRGEQPAAIRAEILAGAPGAREIGDRAEAIGAAVAALGPGDVLVVAGKGHETGQIIGDRTLPFSDHEVLRAAIARGSARMSGPLWTRDEIAAATRGWITDEIGPVAGISIDTRTLKAGDLFFAIKGDARDGHDFVRDALAKGAAAAVVAEARAPDFVDSGTLIVVPDVLGAMRDLAARARARTSAQVVAVTGSVGKTSTKEAMRLVLSRQGATHAAFASYNNHWGVPLTLARMPRSSAFGVFEIGMNHPGEIAPLTRLVRPHVAVVTTVEPVHIEYFRSIWGIADAKGEIFEGLEQGGAAILNRDNPYYERLRAHAAASPGGRILTFGEHPEADVRAERIILKADLSVVEARVLGTPVIYRLGTPGRHMALNSLSILAAVKALGGDLALTTLALGDLKPPVGRGERTVLDAGGEFVLIDESYNANPASVRAALATLGQTEPGFRGRRIAVLGDMLELGPEGASLHRGLVEPIAEHRVDLVFAAGPLMENLFEALPRDRRGAYAAKAADLKDAVLASVRPGDVVMIKGSNSIRMGAIVEALKERFAGRRQSRGVEKVMI